MSELRKANTDSAYFITLTVAGWIDVFNRREYIEILIKNINYCQEHKGLKVFAYVIMPSHIHLVVRQDEDRLNDVLRDFKSFTAKEILNTIANNQHESRREWMLHLFKYFANTTKQNKEYMFWQKTNHPIELYTTAVIDQKIDYIHNNPVEAGIVLDAESYVYSSANRYSEISVIDV